MWSFRLREKGGEKIRVLAFSVITLKARKKERKAGKVRVCVDEGGRKCAEACF